jgi:hypothetical protein
MTNGESEKNIDENERIDSEDEWEEKWARRNERAVGVNAHNREILFAALTAAGVRTVVIDFDAYGGDIDGRIDAYAGVKGEGPIQLPGTSVTIQVIDDDWREWQVKDQTETLKSAIDTVCYEYLEQTHDGWDHHPGAFGTFTFDAADKTIKLDFNERIDDSINFRHEF